MPVRWAGEQVVEQVQVQVTKELEVKEVLLVDESLRSRTTLDLLSSRLDLLSKCHILIVFLYIFYTYSHDHQTRSEYAQNMLRNT